MGELGYPFGPLYRLLACLPMRREEIAAMPVSELELAPGGNCDDAVWTLPAGRTKRANALRVPLSPLARSLIVEAMAVSSDTRLRSMLSWANRSACMYDMPRSYFFATWTATSLPTIVDEK